MTFIKTAASSAEAAVFFILIFNLPRLYTKKHYIVAG
jgi:hypothetical protein